MLEIQWVLFIMVSGGIYFGDFEKFNTLQLAMFGVGVFVLLLGIFCLIPPAAGPGMCQTMQAWLLLACKCTWAHVKLDRA